MAERLTGKDIRNTTILKVDKDNMRIYNTTTEDGEEETVISCDAITKLGKLEDIMERLGINFVEDLEDEIKSLRVDKYVYKKDRDTWKRACKDACKKINIVQIITNEEMSKYEGNLEDYFYQQAKKEKGNN